LSLSRALPRIAALVLVLVLVSGCGTGALSGLLGTTAGKAKQTASQAKNATTKSKSSQKFTVTMTDELKFDPPTLTVPKGAKVTWQNKGQVAHTVTDDPAKVADKSHVSLPEGAQPFDSGPISAGASWSQTFKTPGTYHYVCLPHEAAGMAGTIVVTP